MTIQTKLATKNTLHTLFIFGGMCLLLSLIGFLFAGGLGALFAFFLVIFSFIFTPRISPALIVKIYKAELLPKHHAPELYKVIEELCHRAHIKQIPELYYLPSPIINSFTLADSQTTKIVLSDGLIHQLNLRELIGVLAHEVAHIQNNDLKVMALADVMSRITTIMSLTGLMMLILYIPLLTVGEFHLPLMGIILMTFAPNIAALLQMALARTREFIADQQAVALTGDAIGLANALKKIDQEERYWAKRLLIPHYRLSEPSVLRTHPSGEERISRLLAMASEIQHVELPKWVWNREHYPRPIKKPKHRIHGMWY